MDSILPKDFTVLTKIIVIRLFWLQIGLDFLEICQNDMTIHHFASFE